ncbi:polyprenyl synthetase family protein [Actinokineospora sp. HUAS TT18]|uniref:polyprenyl synthetase family protein n=1 Tax=Actinokineospora sp. HUAS TT18 TaxID=3447451 RepID=UPI003F524300
MNPRSAAAVLAWSRDLIQPALHEAVDRLPTAMRHIAGYHLGWWDEMGEPTAVPGGKSVRPALTLLSAEAAGGSPEAAIPGAVAIELAHNFTLLHDDVLDHDPTRRHRPTAWTVFGVNAAILTGDALLALATDVLAASTHPRATRVLLDAILEVIDGEHADLTFEGRHDVGVPECVAMVERKTAPLLAAACALGAHFADAPPATVDRLREFGRLLGVAYQHVDDLLGIWGDPAATGKPTHADLRSRKKSLPVVAALSSGTAAGRELSTLYYSDEHAAADLAHMAVLVEAAGGRDWCVGQASQLLAQALDNLRAAAPRPSAELAALANLITNRDN